MEQGSLVKSAQDAYLQSIDLAVEAEKSEWTERFSAYIILPLRLGRRFLC